MPECAAKWFLERFKDTLKNGVADLSGELFLLPTRAAARSFKNAVILKVKAISNFNVSTFEDELSKYETKNALNRTTARAIWVSVLRGLLDNNKLPENIFSGAQKWMNQMYSCKKQTSANEIDSRNAAAFTVRKIGTGHSARIPLQRVIEITLIKLK